jgi:hypothetical protein
MSYVPGQAWHIVINRRGQLVNIAAGHHLPHRDRSPTDSSLPVRAARRIGRALTRTSRREDSTKSVYNIQKASPAAGLRGVLKGVASAEVPKFLE